MVFDLQNQDLEQLLLALQGGNQLTQPPLQAMPEQPPQAFGAQQPQQGDMQGQLPQQQLPPQLAQQAATSAQPPRNLGQTFPQDFSGLGIGETAPQVNQQQGGQQDILALLNALQGAGIGGF